MFFTTPWAMSSALSEKAELISLLMARRSAGVEPLLSSSITWKGVAKSPNPTSNARPPRSSAHQGVRCRNVETGFMGS